MFTIDTTNHSIDIDGMRLELYSAEWQQGPVWEPLTDEGKEGPIRTLWGEGTMIHMLDEKEPESERVAFIIDEQGRYFAVVQESRSILHRVYKDPHMGLYARMTRMLEEGLFQPL